MSEQTTETSESAEIMNGKNVVTGKCPSLASRFRGCMLGSLIAPYKAYTDDTAMTFSVAQSLINKNRFDPQDMAKKFVDEFYAHPRRGYASSMTDVFKALKRDDCKDPYGPGRLLYAGRGSYGNGSAMRIAPIALFCHSNAEEAMHIAYKSSLITHANELGYNGAILQCLAIQKALHTDSSVPLDVDQFSLYLQEKMATIEKNEDQPSMLNSFLHNSSQPRRTTINMTKSSYVRKLQEMRHLLKNPTVSAEKVVDVLGHFVSAYGSVCTAIYSFLRSAKDDSASVGGSSESPVQRAIRYAISLGGDTDTIANMTGALAGAYYGHEAVPPVLLAHCEAEGVEQAIELADCLYQAVEK
ncbi:Poly glycohydrolase ARH3 [Daphnia magna]|uniref:ADP-ribosylhydrolase ARH3 n=1 Tax=Daphnia magna TaxID=35525 RepID=A0A164YLI7_9CRUS|nr:Poly glycohydrolase ARH3 [Daphnia magna]